MNPLVTVNGVPFAIHEPLDENKLRQARAKKLGLLARWMFRNQAAGRVFFSKNPAIALFDSSVVIVPRTWDPSGNVENMFGTSAYLFFAESRLTRIGLQTIDNPFVAHSKAASFRELATRYFGAPSDEHPRFVSWTDGNVTVVSEISPDHKHAYFHWFVAGT